MKITLTPRMNVRLVLSHPDEWKMLLAMAMIAVKREGCPEEMVKFSQKIIDYYAENGLCR